MADLASDANGASNGAGSKKEMGMRKILFEKWDKEAVAGELQKNPDILTKIYLGMQWLELHPEFGMQVAKYRAELKQNGTENGGAQIEEKDLVPWKPDPAIVDMWKRWAQDQEEQKADTEAVMKAETGAAASVLDPTRSDGDALMTQRCQCSIS